MTGTLEAEYTGLERKSPEATWYWRKQPPDGWEDLYGPVPRKVPESEWYDWVVVDRVRGLRDPGRKLYRKEIIEALRLGVSGSDQNLVQVLGVTRGRISVWRRLYQKELSDG